MIRKELKSNLKLFLIVLGVLCGTFFLVYIFYPFAMNEETIAGLEEMMKSLPEALLKAFNMDLASLSTTYGWIKTEGWMFALLGVGIFSSMLGGSIVLKEENNKTIEYLATLPIKRSKILTNKIIASMIYIVSLILGFTLFNVIGLALSKEGSSIPEFLLLCVGLFLVALPLYFINLFFSTLCKKNMKMIGISLGIVFVSYFVNLISGLSEDIEGLKYISLYTLADTTHIISENKISVLCIIISILISVIFATVSYIRYNRKELV